MTSSRLGQPQTAASSTGGPQTRERFARWTGATLVEALEGAVAAFEPHVPAINALNVFPVPDGDTGINMLLTLHAALADVERLDPGERATAGNVLDHAAHGALMGARGNSGVILYQILAGIAERCSGAEALDGRLLASGLARAAELAYQAVADPVEGTMLTVIHGAAEAAAEAADRDPAIGTVLRAALTGADTALQQTPQLLEILRQAGVVDAGGQGLVTLLDALTRFSRGEAVAVPTAQAPMTPGETAGAMAFLDRPEIVHTVEEHGYCTNFTLTGTAMAVDAVRQRLTELGRSAVIVGDPSCLKVHVHTEHPGTLLEAALAFGEIEDVRIDNMAAQTRRLLAERSRARHEAGAVTPIGIVAVASGAGLSDALRGMGATAVVPGGPTFNPSTQDILTVVESVPQQEVLVLPNDGNVIGTAQQVEKLTSKHVRVVPSRSVPQGIAALAAYNFGAGLDDNVELMSQAAATVRTIEVTRSTRDAAIGGVTVRAGQYIGLVDGDLRAGGDDPVQVVLDSLRQLDLSSAELVTIFTGEGSDPDIVRRLTEAVATAHPDIEVEVTAGDQPHYPLIVAVE